MEFDGIAQQGTPSVRLTFMVTPIEGFEGKSIYFRKLEIQENVLLERAPGHRFYTTTYEIGFGHPRLIDTPAVEQLEGDLDSLVDSFIQDYKIWNRNGTKLSKRRLMRTILLLTISNILIDLCLISASQM